MNNFETNCAYDIWKSASKKKNVKKKHLCDKYAWWQIMQKFNDFGKKGAFLKKMTNNEKFNDFGKIILKLIAPTFC